MQRILVIKLSSIGDVLQATPVAGSIKKAWPDSHITWLVGEVCADLIRFNPYVDEMLVWPREQFDEAIRRHDWHKVRVLWRKLRDLLAPLAFDVALDIQGLFLTGLISRVVHTPRRIGMNGTKEFNGLFMSETAPPLGKSAMERYLGVLPLLGIYSVERKMMLCYSVRNQEFAASFLRQAGIVFGEKFVVLIPGTTWPAKNWPVELFARVAAALASDYKVVICGGPSEISLGRYIEQQAGKKVINAVNQTGLLDLAAILARAAVVVGGDTGPIYLAAALDVPQVVLFGPTDPDRYLPPGMRSLPLVHRLPCSFCHKRICPQGSGECLQKITPQEVIQAVKGCIV